MMERREIINMRRMQHVISRKLAAPSKLSTRDLEECSQGLHELDFRIGKCEIRDSEVLQELKTSQDNNWDIIKNVVVPQDDFCDDEKSVKVDEDYLGESNEENDKLRFVGVREKLMPVKPSDYSSRVVPSEDISGTEDIQSLLLQQKHISAREVAAEEQKQRELTNELLDLTSLLKENTIIMNETINLQNMQLDEMHHHAEKNVEELDDQKEKMNKQQALQSSSLWTTVYALVTVFISFSLTYAVIRIFPKPQY